MKKLLLLIIIGFLAFEAKRIYDKPLQLHPYPYEFTQNPPIELESSPQILIVGDRMGEKLFEFKNQMQQALSVNLTKPIIIESLAQAGEGFHRTLNKIKRIKKLPKVIIYLGGSEEFHEQKYEAKNIDLILKNMDHYQNSTLQSLLFLNPFFSKFIYENVPLFSLTEAIKPFEGFKEENIILKQAELEYKLYELEMDDFMREVKKQNSLLILLSTPINLEEAPKKTCQIFKNDEIEKVVNELRVHLGASRFKDALLLAKEYEGKVSGHAEFYYLKGLVERKLAQFKEAKQSLEKAVSFDCEKWRADPVFNRILFNYAGKHQMNVFDFENLVYDQWGENVLFFDEIYPQNLYFERSAQALAKILKKILKL